MVSPQVTVNTIPANTVPVMMQVQYSRVTGTVWEISTHGIPVLNPIHILTY